MPIHFVLMWEALMQMYARWGCFGCMATQRSGGTIRRSLSFLFSDQDCSQVNRIPARETQNLIDNVKSCLVSRPANQCGLVFRTSMSNLLLGRIWSPEWKSHDKRIVQVIDKSQYETLLANWTCRGWCRPRAKNAGLMCWTLRSEYCKILVLNTED